MNEITSLFTAFGNSLTQNDWFAMVKWPFWILLTIVAAGGIYCARFGKKTLLNQAVSSTLSLTAIYLFLTILCSYFPSVRNFISTLPFLSATDGVTSLTPPFSLDLVLMGSQMLRLLVLTLAICFTDIFFVSGKTVITWLLSQVFSTVFALFCYSVATAGLPVILPFLSERYAIYFVVPLALFGFLMFSMKIVFTMILPGGNPTFGSIHKFFTTTRGGSLFTVTFISFLLSLSVICALFIAGTTAVTYATVNLTGLLIILVMILVTLFCFAAFFIDRKKA